MPQLSGVAGRGLLLNFGDYTFAKVRVDEATRADLADLLARQPDTLSRALMWNSAFDAVRDSDWPADEFVDLVGAALVFEADVTILDSVFQLARTFAVPRLLPTHSYQRALDVLAATAASIVEGRRRAAAGSSPERARSCRRPARRRCCAAGWPESVCRKDLSSTPICAGRSCAGWRCSASSATSRSMPSCSATPAPAVARRPPARVRRFPTRRPRRPRSTSSSRRRGCPTGLSNMPGTACGSPSTPSSPQSYVERFFAELPVSEGRSPDLLSLIGHAGYPVYAVSQDTLGLAERALAGDLHPQLRRSLVDETDDLRRALKARQAARSA